MPTEHSALLTFALVIARLLSPPASTAEEVTVVTSKTSVKMLERKVWGTYKDGEIQRESIKIEPDVDAVGYPMSDDETCQRILR